MKRFHSLVFDEVISLPNSPTTTSLDWAQKLASIDILQLFTVIDNVQGGGGTVAFTINHSPDGRNWLPKNGGVADMTSNTLTTGTTQFKDATDPNWSTKVASGYVQIQMTLTTSTSAHVKLYVTGRDQGGH